MNNCIQYSVCTLPQHPHAKSHDRCSPAVFNHPHATKLLSPSKSCRCTSDLFCCEELKPNFHICAPSACVPRCMMQPIDQHRDQMPKVVTHSDKDDWVKDCIIRGSAPITRRSKICATRGIHRNHIARVTRYSERPVIKCAWSVSCTAKLRTRAHPVHDSNTANANTSAMFKCSRDASGRTSWDSVQSRNACIHRPNYWLSLSCFVIEYRPRDSGKTRPQSAPAYYPEPFSIGQCGYVHVLLHTTKQRRKLQAWNHSTTFDKSTAVMISSEC